jgi:hypothetical protein
MAVMPLIPAKAASLYIFDIYGTIIDTVYTHGYLIL